MADVAIVGTGRMGAAMARRLVAAGHEVALWNRTRAAAEELASELGAAAHVAGAPAEAVAAAPVALVVLANGAITEAVVSSDDVLAAIAAGAVVVDMGTSGTSTATRLDEVVTSAGGFFVDAPVSGSVATVDAGQLLVMAAGPDDAVDLVEPLLAAFSKRVVRLGRPGNGQVMKLAVNLVVHGLNAILSEALALAEVAGVERASAYDVLQDSVVAAPFLDYKRGVFLGEDDAVAFTLALVDKDLGLIRELAQAAGVPVGVTDAAAESVRAAVDRGAGDRDMARLVEDVLARAGARDGAAGPGEGIGDAVDHY